MFKVIGGAIDEILFHLGILALILVAKIIVSVATIMLKFYEELHELRIAGSLMFIGVTIFLAGLVVTLAGGFGNHPASVEVISAAGIGATVVIFVSCGMITCRRRQKPIGN